jgi:hypothetical protein
VPPRRPSSTPPPISKDALEAREQRARQRQRRIRESARLLDGTIDREKAIEELERRKWGADEPQRTETSRGDGSEQEKKDFRRSTGRGQRGSTLKNVNAAQGDDPVKGEQEKELEKSRSILEDWIHRS